MPVGEFLTEQLGTLKKRRKLISREDPFGKARNENKAAPDTGAEERIGHDRASALRESLDKKIIQTRKALTRVKVGDYGICEECGRMIDTDRLMMRPEATYCVKCEVKHERAQG